MAAIATVMFAAFPLTSEIGHEDRNMPGWVVNIIQEYEPESQSTYARVRVCCCNRNRRQKGKVPYGMTLCNPGYPM